VQDCLVGMQIKCNISHAYLGFACIARCDFSCPLALHRMRIPERQLIFMDT
jgi:hypothetical protein